MAEHPTTSFEELRKGANPGMSESTPSKDSVKAVDSSDPLETKHKLGAWFSQFSGDRMKAFSQAESPEQIVFVITKDLDSTNDPNTLNAAKEAAGGLGQVELALKLMDMQIRVEANSTARQALQVQEDLRKIAALQAEKASDRSLPYSISKWIPSV